MHAPPPPSRRAHARCAPFLVVLLVLLGARPQAGADPGAAGQGHDRWYVLRMQDQRAGWLHDRRDATPGSITSTTELRFELKRGETVVVVSLQAEFVETPEGKPVSMKLVQTLGAHPSTESFTFTPEGIDVVTDSAAGKRTASRALPDGQWLTPAAASRFIRQRLEAGAKEIKVRTIDPTSGVEPILYTNTVLERTQTQALGKTVPAIKWRVLTDRRPEVGTVEFVDERGVPIRSETSLGDLKIEVILADRELALAKIDAPEMLLSTLVRPDHPIGRPRQAASARFVLSIADDAGALKDLPAGPAQRVEPRPDGSVLVTVDAAGGLLPPDKDAPGDEYLAESMMLPSDDPIVRQLAERAAGSIPATEPGRRAESMRRFVYSHIKQKDLGVGFASAAEVARTKAGDCTEHAVLLAAMLRAQQIPARVVSGLIYAEQFEGARDIFGYHMWTQAWVKADGVSGGGRWVDLDATLGPQRAFDATHIALAVSALADGETTNTMVTLVPLLGRLHIRVEHVEQEP